MTLWEPKETTTVRKERGEAWVADAPSVNHCVTGERRCRSADPMLGEENEHFTAGADIDPL